MTSNSLFDYYEEKEQKTPTLQTRSTHLLLKHHMDQFVVVWKKNVSNKFKNINKFNSLPLDDTDFAIT